MFQLKFILTFIYVFIIFHIDKLRYVTLFEEFEFDMEIKMIDITTHIRPNKSIDFSQNMTL